MVSLRLHPVPSEAAMSDETPVERRLQTSVARRNSDGWTVMDGVHTRDLDCGREAIAVVRDLLAYGRIALPHTPYADAKQRAVALLAKCREDGR